MGMHNDGSDEGAGDRERESGEDVEGIDIHRMNWFNLDQQLGFMNMGFNCRVYVPLGDSHADLSRAEAVWLHEKLNGFLNA